MNDTFGISLGEASTWRGVVALLALLGIHFDPAQSDAIIQLGLAGYAFFAIFWKRTHPATGGITSASGNNSNNL